MRGGALLLALALAATGCLARSAAPEEAPADTGPGTPLIEQQPAPEPGRQTLRWALRAPEEIVPPLANTPSELAVVEALFDPLTRIDSDGVPRPLAARSWRSNPRATVWSFTLRSGAVFHDGTDVTAADVAFSWEEGIRQGRGAPHLQDVRGYGELRRGEAERLDGLVVRGERTLQVLLDRPRADFDMVVAHPSLAPVPAAAWQRDAERFRADPTGNGPFAITEEWADGGFVRAQRSEAWANGPRPAVGEVLFRFTDVSSGFVAFQQERVDIADVPAGGLDAALERFGEASEDVPGVMRGDTAEVYLLAMNTQAPPFDAVGVRRALSFALDREAIVAQVPDENATVARGLAPTTVPGAQVSSCSTCLHAPDSASRLFEEHGIDRLELWVNAEGGHQEIAEEIASGLAEVGVTLVVRSVPFEEFVEAVESGEATLYRYGWSAEHPTLEDVLVPLLQSGASSLAEGNPGGYSNPEVDALLQEASATTDAQERIALLNAAEDLALGREQALIPVMFTRQRLVVGEGVEGFAVGPTGRVDLTRVRLVEDEG